MIQRFLLDRIHVNGTWIAVSDCIKFPVPVDPVMAITEFTGFQGAFIWTDKALHAPWGFRIEKGLPAPFVLRSCENFFSRKAKKATCTKKPGFYKFSLD